MIENGGIIIAKKKNTPAEKSDKRTEIILVRHFGDKDFIQLYAEYVATKILDRAEEERKSA